MTPGSPTQCQHGPGCTSCQMPAQSRAHPKDTDFNVIRAYSLLLTVTVLPMYLALTVVSYSFNGLLL